MEKKTPELIAQEALDKIKKAKESKAQEDKPKDEAVKVEPKGATSESSPEKPKTEEQGKSIEEQAKVDEVILSKEEKDLTEPEKARKSELIKIKESKETPEDKVKKWQESTQKRIDEITSKLKDSEHKSSQEINSLKVELDKLQKENSELKQKVNKPAEVNEEKQAEIERINKYLAEDKDKDRSERREMSKDEIDDWYLEDPVSATEWINNRSIRRSEEKKEWRQSKNTKVSVQEITAKQSESVSRAEVAYPEIVSELERVNIKGKELRSQGKSLDEINKVLNEEFPVFKLLNEVTIENPSKYLHAEDGPELTFAEVSRRLKNNPTTPKKVTYTEEDVERIKKEAIENERKRIEGLDEGIGSTVPGKPKLVEEPTTEFENIQLKIAKKAGISPERLKEVKSRRSGIPGINADQYKEEVSKK